MAKKSSISLRKLKFVQSMQVYTWLSKVAFQFVTFKAANFGNLFRIMLHDSELRLIPRYTMKGYPGIFHYKNQV